MFDVQIGDQVVLVFWLFYHFNSFYLKQKSESLEFLIQNLVEILEFIKCEVV